MGKIAKYSLILTCWLLLLFNLCGAHEAHIRTIEDGVVVEAFYDEANPMSSCKVQITRPSDSTYLLSGTTDEHGRFAFVPDGDGIWKIKVSDGIGHMATLNLKIEEGDIYTKGKNKETGRFSGLIVGISVIFGLFGIFVLLSKGFGYKHTGKSNKNNEPF